MSAVIRAGSLSCRVSLERRSETLTASGEAVPTWLPYAVAHAQRVVLSTEEFLTGPGEGERRSVVFRLRWRPDVRLADRLVHDGIAYGLTEIVELGRKAGLELRGVAS